MAKTEPEAFQAYVEASERVIEAHQQVAEADNRVNQAHKNTKASLEVVIAGLQEASQIQNELLEVYKQEAEDAEKKIEQQRVEIQTLKDKLAEHK